MTAQLLRVSVGNETFGGMHEHDGSSWNTPCPGRQMTPMPQVGNPEGPCTQLLGTWDLGSDNHSTGCGEVYDY